MSKQKAGIGVSVSFAIASALVPGIPERYRLMGFAISVIALILCGVWYLVAPKSDIANGSHATVSTRSGPVSGPIAGGDIVYHVAERAESTTWIGAKLHIESVKPPLCTYRVRIKNGPLPSHNIR